MKMSAVSDKPPYAFPTSFKQAQNELFPKLRTSTHEYSFIVGTDTIETLLLDDNQKSSKSDANLTEKEGFKQLQNDLFPDIKADADKYDFIFGNESIDTLLSDKENSKMFNKNVSASLHLTKKLQADIPKIVTPESYQQTLEEIQHEMFPDLAADTGTYDFVVGEESFKSLILCKDKGTTELSSLFVTKNPSAKSIENISSFSKASKNVKKLDKLQNKLFSNLTTSTRPFSLDCKEPYTNELTGFKNLVKRAGTDSQKLNFCVNDSGFKLKSGSIPDKKKTNLYIEPRCNNQKTLKVAVDTFCVNKSGFKLKSGRVPDRKEHNLNVEPLSKNQETCKMFEDGFLPGLKENKNKNNFLPRRVDVCETKIFKQKIKKSTVNAEKYDLICEQDLSGSLSINGKKNNKQNNMNKIVRVTDVVFPTDIKESVDQNEINKTSCTNKITKKHSFKHIQNKWLPGLTVKYDFICEEEPLINLKKNNEQNNLTKIVRVEDIIFPTDIKDTNGENKVIKTFCNSKTIKQQSCKQKKDKWLPGLLMKYDFICEQDLSGSVLIDDKRNNNQNNMNKVVQAKDVEFPTDFKDTIVDSKVIKPIRKNKVIQTSCNNKITKQQPCKQKQDKWVSDFTVKYDFICEQKYNGSKLSDINKKNNEQNKLTKVVQVSDVASPIVVNSSYKKDFKIKAEETFKNKTRNTSCKNQATITTCNNEVRKIPDRSQVTKITDRNEVKNSGGQRHNSKQAANEYKTPLQEKSPHLKVVGKSIEAERDWFDLSPDDPLYLN